MTPYIGTYGEDEHFAFFSKQLQLVVRLAYERSVCFEQVHCTHVETQNSVLSTEVSSSQMSTNTL